MRFGLTVQTFHLLNAHAPTTRAFDRPPVIIGRDDTAANCVLPDPSVSRVHASIDLRDDRIWVRDAGSRNGTLVQGHPIAPDQWFVACGRNARCELRIGDWVLSIVAHEVRTAAAGMDFLTAYSPGLEAGGCSGTFVSEGSVLPIAPPAAPAANATVIHPPLKVARAFAQLTAMRKELADTLVEALDVLNPDERPRLVGEIVALCPGIESEPSVRGLLEKQGRRPLPHSLETGSAVALQELARWYVNDVPPLASAADAFAFARKVKASIDEVLSGLVPLFAGLDRFEQQMALRPERLAGNQPTSARLPRIPRDAARRLFDWRDNTDYAVRAIRTDLVDLTMHQVAMLNGVMQGVKVLLTELAPTTLEKVWERRNAERGLLARFFGRLRPHAGKWAVYRERHSDLADEENERFRVIFGPEFAAEYKHSGDAMNEAARPGPH